MRISLLFILLNLMILGCQSSDKKRNQNVATKSEAISQRAKQAATSESPLSKKNIYEELTGKSIVAQGHPARKVLSLARQAKQEKNYTLAIKRYNTLLVKFPKAAEVKDAYFDKAEMYREMGLLEQAQYNQQLALKAMSEQKKLVNKQAQQQQKKSVASKSVKNMNKTVSKNNGDKVQK
ncbi:MAG: hypothetical protein ACK41T_06765 [Pseudobdellovibrio sp.]